MYYTYIVASRSRTLYVGVTSDLMVRVWQHREGAYNGFSKVYKCNRLVWFEEYGEVLDAIAREKQLKGWRRSKKIALIERENVAWVDLSEGWGEMMGRLCFRTGKGKYNCRSFDFAQDDRNFCSTPLRVGMTEFL